MNLLISDESKQQLVIITTYSNQTIDLPYHGLEGKAKSKWNQIFLSHFLEKKVRRLIQWVQTDKRFCQV